MKLQIKHHRFRSEKAAASRKWVALVEQKWLWRALNLAFVTAMIVVAGFYLVGRMMNARTSGRKF